jgi:hypothetical protein
MAHALGTPVAMMNIGSAPEYAVPGDLIVPADVPLSQFFKEASVMDWQRVPALADAQRVEALTAYRREFESLGWI